MPWSILWIFLLDCTGGAVYAWLLGDEEICSKCVASEKFHGTCNFDIVRLNDKILPKSEQGLKFLKQITELFLTRNDL
ncbi:hypothetical protein [Campylobacter concisus]|uniref:hypothetical protein n=1 Tax=Campylobacter concisus TaxID=199 RepID=UPI00122C8A15|nr:hypothetical protein [Campylobacter concisus]